MIVKLIGNQIIIMEQRILEQITSSLTCLMENHGADFKFTIMKVN